MSSGRTLFLASSATSVHGLGAAGSWDSGSIGMPDFLPGEDRLYYPGSAVTPTSGNYLEKSVIGVQMLQSRTKFYPLELRRLVDTREASGPLGGPSLAGGVARTFPAWSNCSIPRARALLPLTSLS